MDKVTFSRKELYDLVWLEPVTALAKKYNISDLELRKACISMNVPLPQSGHWSKIKAGKVVPKEDMRLDYKGPTEISINIMDETSKKSKVTLLAPSISIPQTLVSPHALIV